MAVPAYTVRVITFNLTGPVTATVFTAPALGHLVLRSLDFSPTNPSGFAAIYVTDPSGSVLFHLVRHLAGDGQTMHVDTRAVLEAGEHLVVGLPAGGTMNGQITGYLFDE